MWDEHTILARGIVTTRDGDVVSRPFPKFFNLGEKEAEPIDWKEPVELSEKIDGSLICVYTYDEKIFVNSKGSFTSEHAQFARKWIKENLPDWKPNDCYTYLFEAVLPAISENEVKVINYGNRADLTLLAIINILTGDEYDYEEMKRFADNLKIPLVPRYTSDTYATINKVKSRASIQEGEGIVIHFLKSNKRIKVKSDVYMRLHRLISHANKKTILEMIIKGDNMEEIYAPLPDEFYRDVKQWVKEFTDKHDQLIELINKNLPVVKALPTRSAQSKYIYGNPELANIQGLMFVALDGYDISDPVWKLIKKQYKENK